MRRRAGVVAALASVVLLGLSLLPAPQPFQLDRPRHSASSGIWTTYHRDDAHTGYDPSLSKMNVTTAGWVSPALDAAVYAEPLIYNGMVYAATLNNSVYALDQFTGAVVWHTQTSAPMTGGWTCGNVSPMGILGTPVIDAAAGRIYVATLSSDGLYRVVALNLNTGAPLMSTALPQAQYGFDWHIQQERGALALRNGYVYVPFGGRAGDCGLYHGWVFAVPVDGSAVPQPFVTGGTGIGIWSAGGVVVDDATGNVYVSTGNGTAPGGAPDGCAQDAQGNPIYHNNAVEKLSPTLAELDFFMPQDWHSNWCTNDQDLGSAAPVLLNSNLLFQAGKWGGGFLVRTTSLGGVNGQAYPPAAGYTQAEVCFGNHSDATFGSFAYAAPYVYVSCEGRGLVALSTDPTVPSFTACDASCPAPNWSTGGTLNFGPPIVAAGAVWVADQGGTGLYAFDATTGTQIYHSYSFGIRRFVTPAEAGGQVFVPSGNVIRDFNMDLAWRAVGGVVTSGPDPSTWAANRMDVFARGQEGGLWDATWDGTSWSWTFLGGLINADPSAVSWGANRIDVFVRGVDNALWHRAFNGVGWLPWEKLGGVITSGPDVASWGPNRLDVFVSGSEHGLWQVTWDGVSWMWHFVGGVISSDPGAVSSQANRIDVFARGQEGGMWQASWNGATWSWTFLGGRFNTGPDVASCSAGHLDLYATGLENGLWHRGFNGASWGSWQFMGGGWTNDPGAVCTPGTTSVQLFERGTNGTLLVSTQAGT